MKTATEVLRTQGEWKVNGKFCDYVMVVNGKKTTIIAQLPILNDMAVQNYEERRANATFICKAVNNYDTMLNALKDIAGKINRDTFSTDGLDYLQLSHNECQQLKEILRKAEQISSPL